MDFIEYKIPEIVSKIDDVADTNAYIEQILSEEFSNEFTTKVLSLGDFHAYKRQRHMASHVSIAAYMLHLLNKKGVHAKSCVLLPSLHCLTKFFKAPTLEVQKAFQHLRAVGHDYIMPGYYGHISLWTL